LKRYFLFILLALLSAQALPAESADSGKLDAKSGFPEITDKPFVVFNEGFTSAWVTRIVLQEDRSNFVIKDFMPGVCFGFTTHNMRPLNSTVRLAVYYPYASTFNGVPQKAKNVIRYAVDCFAGPVFQPDMWNYVRFNLAPGIHVLYQTGDRFCYIDLGAAALAGVEFPVSRGWTVLLDGLFAVDYGNLGTNAAMEPYDYVWEYQLSLSVRYSVKAPNRYSYLRAK